MDSTPLLGLPLLAAAQAQKHVTHNEGLAALDALVHLSVKERNRNAPPGSPAMGERYLVGSAPTGAFAGHAGRIAVFDAGAWTFLAARAGWRLYVENEDRLLVFTGTAWRDLGADVSSLNNLALLGLGTTADSTNPFAVKLNGALFTAKTIAESGSGDLRFTLNKEAASRSLSQLYQSGYSGRAETGLMGDDDFHIKVSADGSSWREALRIDRSSGEIVFPSGAPQLGGFRNLLINADFTINQRGFAGGSLAAGLYGFDRWKAGTGGCTLARAGDGTLTLTGSLVQVIENPGLAGATVTVSVKNPTATLAVSIGGTSGSIASGPGRRWVTLSLPSGATGNVTVSLTGTAVSFARPLLEIGNAVSAFEAVPDELVLKLCQRYFTKTFAGAPAMNAGTADALCAASTASAANGVAIDWRFPAPMRAFPTVTLYNPGGTGANFINSAAASIAASAAASVIACVIVNTATTSYPALHYIHATVESEL